MSRSSVLPLGRQLGLYPDERTPGGVSADLQLGADRPVLSRTAFQVWEACHGRLDRAPGAGWDLSDVTDLAAAWGLGAEDVQRGWAELETVGAVTTLATDDASREAFARHHTLQPLQLGLGNTEQDPATFSVGLVGRPVVGMPKGLYDLWAYSGLAADLWSSVVAHDEAYRAAGLDSDPHQLLGSLVDSLHALLCVHASFIDPVWSAAPGGELR